jgi:hypothetical protein
MSAPTYEVGDILYLRESAALGFLEPVRISGVRSNNGGWVYMIQSRASEPSAPSTYGDRISQVTGQVLFFGEEELIERCAALRIMEAAAIANLNKIQTDIQNSCE